MDKLEDGLAKVLAGLQQAVEGYNESIAGKRTLDERLTGLEESARMQNERILHLQETIDVMQKMWLEGRE